MKPLCVGHRCDTQAMYDLQSRWWTPLLITVVYLIYGAARVAARGTHVVKPSAAATIIDLAFWIFAGMLPAFWAGIRYQRWKESEPAS